MNEDRFIERATNHKHDTKQFREHIVFKFKEIHENVDCKHHEPCSYYLAEGILLQQDTKGPVIECGCFQGGMSAKFSVICKEIGKELHVVDSFKGLPFDESAVHWNGKEIEWEKGDFKCILPEVVKNIKDFGEVDVCKFHKGWVEDIVPEMEISPSLIFVDLDIVSSALVCIKHFWNRLQGDRFYTHEACYKTYMEGILDETWWKDNLKENPPECVGKVNGFYDARCLAYLKKVK